MRLSIKLLLISELVLLTAVVALVTPVWWHMKGQIVESMQNELRAIASTAALQIQGDMHKRVRTMDDVGSDAFRTIQTQLEKVRLANDVQINHLYTFYRDGDVMRFAVMLNPDDELFVGNPYPIAPLMRPVLEQGTMESTDLYEDEFGRWISAYAPIKSSRGEVVGLLAVDKDSREYFASFFHYVTLTLALALLALAISSILGYWVLQRIVIRPVSAVRNGMLAIGRHDFGYRVRIRTNDELQELGETLNSISEQFDVARIVQQKLFPTILPRTDHYRVSARWAACDATGGDYYDAFALADGRLVVVVADVSGHGLGPSLLMASCRSALRGLSNVDTSPGAVVAQLDRLMSADLGDRFITLIYGVLDADGTFTYSNFGHGPAMVVLKGELTHLVSHRPPLGIHLDFNGEPVESSCRLEPGDRVFLASDGLPDALNRQGARLGAGRMEEVVRDVASPGEAVVDRLMQIQVNHCDGRLQTDDITLVCVDRV